MIAIPCRLLISTFCFVVALTACTESGGSGQGSTKHVKLLCDEGQKSCSGGLPPELSESEQLQSAIILNLHSPELPALKPLGFELTFSGKTARIGFDESALVRAWIEGRDMFMGEHRLEATYDSLRQTFILRGMIPVCVTGSEMIWRLSVELDIDNTRVLAYADLRSLKHS